MGKQVGFVKYDQAMAYSVDTSSLVIRLEFISVIGFVIHVIPCGLDDIAFALYFYAFKPGGHSHYDVYRMRVYKNA